MGPFIIPFFLTHAGCPHRCLYCDQRRSGGGAGRLRPEDVTPRIEAGLASPRRKPGARVEAAFYGGTFTALPRQRQRDFLEAVQPFLADGRVQGIRLSTRPDALEADEVAFLKGWGVTIVEIGAPSLDDAVLARIGRGHDAAQVAAAAERVQAAGMRLGLQLLPGLPGEDLQSLRATLRAALAIRPDEARLYPALVIRDTGLDRLFLDGAYRPWTLDRAVGRLAFLHRRLTRSGVRVTRVGLQHSPELLDGLRAGPHHPALGHLVRSTVYARALSRALRLKPPAKKKEAVIQVAPADRSEAVGAGRENLVRLGRTFRLEDLRLETDPELSRARFRWQGEEYDVYAA